MAMMVKNEPAYGTRKPRRKTNTVVVSDFHHGNNRTTGTSSQGEAVSNAVTTQPREITIVPTRRTDESEQLTNTQQSLTEDMEMLNQQMEKQGYTTTYMDDTRKVKEYTRQTLFCKLKFINSSYDLYKRGAGTISKYVMDALNIKPSCREDFWEKQAPNLKRALNQRRANCCSDIGKVFIGKYMMLQFGLS